MEAKVATDLYQGAMGLEYHAQREQGRSEHSQAVRRGYFEGLSGPDDVLLDFGCATGAVAAGLPARERWGVEINEFAAAEARTRLDRVVDSLGAIDSGSVDRLMSFHAIEHVADPISAFAEFKRVLRPGGRGRLIVPYEDVVVTSSHRRWRANDSDMHLFAWTPLTFGNALTLGGLAVQDVRVTHWASGGRLGKFLGPAGLGGAARWINALRSKRLQIVANIARD